MQFWTEEKLKNFVQERQSDIRNFLFNRSDFLDPKSKIVKIGPIDSGFDMMGFETNTYSIDNCNFQSYYDFDKCSEYLDSIVYPLAIEVDRLLFKVLYKSASLSKYSERDIIHESIQEFSKDFKKDIEVILTYGGIANCLRYLNCNHEAYTEYIDNHSNLSGIFFLKKYVFDIEEVNPLHINIWQRGNKIFLNARIDLAIKINQDNIIGNIYY